MINNLNPNPIIALIWAAGHYKNNYNYASVDKNEFRNLENKLFPLYRQTQEIINYDKPHIVVNLMESFGTNMLLLDDEKEFDLLGSLRKHFDSVGLFDNSKQNRSDFLFTRFFKLDFRHCWVIFRVIFFKSYVKYRL